jgi:hypothetical protein
MARPIDLLRQGKKEELWQMCCGFIDLSLEEFMAIQKKLLLEQIELLKNCELGRKVMRGAMPKTVEEFREQVPLTTYGDYLPELAEKREDILPAKVAMWVRTSGHTGKYDVKWVPWAERYSDEAAKLYTGFVIFAFCNGRGDLSQIEEHMKYLFAAGDFPYSSATYGYFVQQVLGVDLLPSNPRGIPFQERVKAGLEEAMYQGLDGFFSLGSVMVAVGEQFKQQSGMLPKDKWKIKWLTTGGADAGIFKERVKELWGRYPLEVYGGTECFACAT